MDIDERLNQIEEKIKQESFRKNKGLGNEVGYYIFDYNPEDELKVRDYVKYLKDKINNKNFQFKIIEFDLYDILIDILKNKNFLQKTFKFEETKGRDFIKDKAVGKLLKLTQNDNLIVNYIINNTSKNSVVFLTGVGKAYPLIRSHNILNNLNLKLDIAPVIMFFPGKYSGTDLVLFNTIKDGNYYRAFKLVE
ncbi:hypothetical protein BGI41_00860 [Methanobrevibacter sp. 87.7]|uniref:DUF1788 domain-containing protein n=1 Tax=Methanobrevibacter sp. 87.7 TaxID=387957 RepID=UPI000B5105D2|nr:DUF1788 domain-containing protein [Methanobrevibacter sp. 87.7]OWT33743.1 hypothetical protein BGI41_00860 [Methanobrevibacter sp. 87.7]